MPSPEIEEFAKVLVQQVRDAAVQSSDRRARADAQNVVTRRWKQVVRNERLEQIADVLIPDIVDDTVFHILRAIDQGLLQLSFTASNGKVVDLPSDGLGELAGWYMGSGGWRAMYSHERLVDERFRDA
jgi:hypothetical protein